MDAPLSTLPVKPKRKPPKFDPLSPHAVRCTIVARLVKPESLKQKGAWGRELNILKRLQARYLDDAFWLELDPAELLDSLSWFVTSFGQRTLADQWSQHLFRRAQEDKQSEIDSRSRPDTLDQTGAIEGSPPLRRKPTAVAWADDE